MIPSRINNSTNNNKSIGFNNNKNFHYEEEYLEKNEDILEIFKTKYQKYNCSKDCLRTSINIFPKNNFIIRDLSLPISLVMSPIFYTQEKEIPLINYGEKDDIPRCKNPKCKAFLNPFVKFKHGSDRWECNICKRNNIVEGYYYCGVDNNGIRLDQNTKPELNYGTYEFVANKNYWIKNKAPNIPIFYFLLDVSLNSISNGFIQCVLESLKDLIINNSFYNYDSFDIKICIITYDTSINFYSINDKSNQISMLCVNDDPIFIPTYKTHLLLSIKKDKNKLIQIIELIESSLNSNNNKESDKMFEAIKAVTSIGELSGGKIMIFNGTNTSNLKIMNDPNIKLNENNKKYIPSDNRKIGSFGIELTQKNYSVNLFLSCNSYTNLLTLYKICENTNGHFYFYKNFSLEKDYKNIYNQIKRTLMNKIGFECRYNIKISHGYYIDNYITPVLLYNRETYALPCQDVDQKFTASLDMYSKEELNDEIVSKKTINDDFVYIQTALSYSYGDGTMRIRVSNLCIPTSSKPKEIFDSIDPECLTCLYLQGTIYTIYKEKNLVNSVIETEKSFCSFFSAYFNIINSIKKELSPKLGLLSLYLLGLMKLNLFSKNEKGFKNDIDLSNYYRFLLLKMSIEEILSFIYPRIYLLDNILELSQEQKFSTILSDTKMSFDEGNLFLIDNGFILILFLKKNINTTLLNYILGVDSVEKIKNINEINENNIFEEDRNENEFKEKIKELLEIIRGNKSLYQNISIVFEGVNDEIIYKEILIEDNFNKNYPYDYKRFYEEKILNSFK